MLFMLKNVRIAFAQALFDAAQFDGKGDFYFSSTFLIDPVAQADQVKLMKAAFLEVAKEKWKDKAAATLKALEAGDRLPLHDGNLKASYDGFPDMLYVSARDTKRPHVIDKDKSVLSKADGRPYSGCYVNAQVDLWPQDNKYGKRINATLKVVQFVKDGESFGASTSGDVDEFEDLSGSEELV